MFVSSFSSLELELMLVFLSIVSNHGLIWTEINTPDVSSWRDLNYGAVGYNPSNNRVYFVGGWSPYGQGTAVDSYNILTDEWISYGNGILQEDVHVDGEIYTQIGNKLIIGTKTIRKQFISYDLDTESSINENGGFEWMNNGHIVESPTDIASAGCLTSYLDNYLIYISSDDKSLNIYDIENDLWFTELPDTNHKHSSESCIVNDDGFLYVIGGDHFNNYIYSVEKIDLSDIVNNNIGSWLDVTIPSGLINVGHDTPRAIIHENIIYIETQTSDDGEIYSIDTSNNDFVAYEGLVNRHGFPTSALNIPASIVINHKWYLFTLSDNRNWFYSKLPTTSTPTPNEPPTSTTSIEDLELQIMDINMILSDLNVLLTNHFEG